MTLLKSGEVSYLSGNGYFVMCIYKPCCSNGAHPVPSHWTAGTGAFMAVLVQKEMQSPWSRSPGLFISTLLARGLAPTRNLEPADSYTVCVQTYFWISGSCILLVDAHSSPRSPRKSHTCTQNRTCPGEVSKQLCFPVTDRFQRAVSPPHLLWITQIKCTPVGGFKNTIIFCKMSYSKYCRSKNNTGEGNLQHRMLRKLFL